VWIRIASRANVPQSTKEEQFMTRQRDELSLALSAAIAGGLIAASPGGKQLAEQEF
jgi:hypothetical protein